MTSSERRRQGAGNYLWQHYAPSAGTVVPIWVALGLFVIGVGCSLAMWLTPTVEKRFAAGAGVLGGVVLPAVALVLILSTVRESRPGPRALLWGAAALVLLLGAVVVALTIATDPATGPGPGSFFLAAICGPIVLAVSLPGVYYWVKGLPDLRQARFAFRVGRLTVLLAQRGQMTCDEIAEALHVPPSEVTALVQAAVATPDGAVVWDPSQQRLYSAQALRAQQQRLLDVVHARGQATLDELAEELNIPSKTVQDWIYTLVGQGRFSGYINWVEGRLYSVEAAKLSSWVHCPSCGGELSLAGKGVVRCNYCGADIFLSP